MKQSSNLLFIKLNQSERLLAEQRNLLLFFSHLSFRVLTFAVQIMSWYLDLLFGIFIWYYAKFENLRTFKYLIGEKFVGVMFRRLKVSSNRKKFVTFHRRKHLTNFEISIFSKNIISEKRYRYIFLIYSFFSFSTTMSMSMPISIIVFSSSWKLYPLVAITSGFRMDNIPVINRLALGMQKKVGLKSFALKVIRSNLSSGS